MVAIQFINKLLADQDFNVILNNGLMADYFQPYDKEFAFILEHFNSYKNIPDVETFISEFTDWEFFEVSESYDYLLDRVYEAKLYIDSVAIHQEYTELLKEDANKANAYLFANLDKLSPLGQNVGTDIVKQSEARVEDYKRKLAGVHPFYIPTGLPELDDMIQGWSCGEEFAVIVGRTGQGKSWLLLQTCTQAWRTNKRVGFISPEMSALKVGYRFDTLNGHYSNQAIVRGGIADGYTDYLDNLSNKDGFIVATPNEFRNEVTVSKLRQFAITHSLDMLAIDGISYIRDERGKRSDNKTTTLTNVSEDLMSLSIELGIPVLVAVQSNREGVDPDSPPDIEHVRDSDGIAFNASKIIAIKQKDGNMIIKVRKYRDGMSGGEVLYNWSADTGQFIYVPSDSDGVSDEFKAWVTDERMSMYGDTNIANEVF